MFRKRGVSLVEVITVLAILVVVASFAMPAISKAKENGKQVACMSQLRQIYLALEMYGADNPRFEPIHANVPLPNAPMSDPYLLLPYMKSKEILYCPDTPDCARAKYLSSYIWTAAPPEGSPLYETARIQLDERFKGPSPEYPVVHCLVHDELHYFPRERSLAESLDPPFVVRLKVDGGVVRGRFDIHRGHDIARACR